MINNQRIINSNLFHIQLNIHSTLFHSKQVIKAYKQYNVIVNHNLHNQLVYHNIHRCNHINLHLIIYSCLTHNSSIMLQSFNKLYMMDSINHKILDYHNNHQSNHIFNINCLQYLNKYINQDYSPNNLKVINFHMKSNCNLNYSISKYSY